MKVALRRDPSTQVAAVLAFVISHTTFLTAQDDETGRCPKVCEKTLPASQPSPLGEGKEKAASPSKKEANPASLRSAAPSKGRGSRGHSLLPLEGGAPKGRRLDGRSGMKERGDCFKCAIIRESPATHL